jgi:hypothetical protein
MTSSSWCASKLGTGAVLVIAGNGCGWGLLSSARFNRGLVGDEPSIAD